MTGKNRIDYLDSVRGIAAMMVVVYHFIGWKWEQTLSFRLSSIVFNGSDAVSFFFVLSGFVLSYQYFENEKKEIRFKNYVLKRFFRIYPAFVVTVLLNYIYVNRLTLGLNTLTDIFYYNNQKLWQELILVKNFHKFYNPGWSLGVEMIISLLLPFFIIVARKNIFYIWYLIPITVFINGGNTSIFTMHFCLGILLAYYYPKIQQCNFKESRFYKYRWGILLAVIMLFSIRHIDRMHSVGNQLKSFLQFWGIDFFHITGVASALILVLIIHSRFLQRILEKKPLLFIGRISYSIYLIHWIVVLIIMDNWEKLTGIFQNGYVKFYVMLLAAVFSTLLLATLLYYFVELPFILWVKKRKIEKEK